MHCAVDLAAGLTNAVFAAREDAPEGFGDCVVLQTDAVIFA
jgi:hypothetical protein